MGTIEMIAEAVNIHFQQSGWKSASYLNSTTDVINPYVEYRLVKPLDKYLMLRFYDYWVRIVVGEVRNTMVDVEYSMPDFVERVEQVVESHYS